MEANGVHDSLIVLYYISDVFLFKFIFHLHSFLVNIFKIMVDLFGIK